MRLEWNLTIANVRKLNVFQACHKRSTQETVKIFIFTCYQKYQIDALSIDDFVNETFHLKSYVRLSLRRSGLSISNTAIRKYTEQYDVTRASRVAW